LWINQETVHDFILLSMPPCGPHLTLLATGSLEQSLLVFSTLGGLTGNVLSCLFLTCSNTSQTATCTCNTWPRISPHNVVNSSHQEATIHRSSNHIWSSTVGEVHELVIPRGLKFYAPELDFESDWEGVRAAHSLHLGHDLGANHHRAYWWGANLSVSPLPGAPTIGAESSPDTN
jgi:hypothetical protein